MLAGVQLMGAAAQELRMRPWLTPQAGGPANDPGVRAAKQQLTCHIETHSSGRVLTVCGFPLLETLKGTHFLGRMGTVRFLIHDWHALD